LRFSQCRPIRRCHVGSQCAQWLRDDIRHAHGRVQARKRILEHDLEAGSHRPQLCLRQILDGAA
jgi:hypothetical protein